MFQNLASLLEPRRQTTPPKPAYRRQNFRSPAFFCVGQYETFFLYKIRLYENINGVVAVFELLRDGLLCDTVYLVIEREK